MPLGPQHSREREVGTSGTCQRATLATPHHGRLEEPASVRVLQGDWDEVAVAQADDLRGHLHGAVAIGDLAAVALREVRQAHRPGL
eukprot:8264905-Lingulodinium_polyedra.AAC.1